VWLSLLLIALLPSAARAQMPDPRMMHGQAIPAGELATGTVTVRVVRQALGNNVAGAEVELHGAGDVRRTTTGADGRAQFEGVPTGARVHARATIDGESLASNSFVVPASGGVRTILVAGLNVQRSAPPATGQRGTGAGLHLGNNTRVAVEFQDDTITVFYLLELINDTGAPVPLTSVLVIELPDAAVGTSLFEGASPLAAARGTRVTVSGPIPPGVTEVPIAYRLEQWDERLTIEQRFPVPLDDVALAIQRLPGMGLESAQAQSVRDASLRGQAFLIASGPGIPAGTPLVFTLTGLPHRSSFPLYTALGLAAGIVLAAIWLIVRPDALSQRTSRQRALQTQRTAKLHALAALDADHRAGRVEASRYQSDRTALLAELEQIYRELEGQAFGPRGGRGLAA
jgi:hypothetical protein